MAIHIVPYNNAMRLGQGFNSYTQRICIDDAVVVDPARAENVVTNDGTTMRILSEKTATPSAWNRQQEVVEDDRADATLHKQKLDKAVEQVEEDQDAAAADPNPALKTSPTQLRMKAADSSEVRDDSLAIIDVHNDQPSERKASGEVGEGEDGLALSMPHLSARVASTKTDDDSSKLQSLTPGGSTRPKVPDATRRAAERKLKDADAAKERRAQEQWAARKQDSDTRQKEERKKLEEQRKYEEEVQKETRNDERERRREDRVEQAQIRKEKRNFAQKQRESAFKTIEKSATLEATTLAELKKIAAQNEFANRFSGMFENTTAYTFDPAGARGPSQVVTYSSRFVDRLSDITEDMCISGSLSIKAGKIGGSGKGSFVDSDKFKESDLNFYISVKVVNQTINFKDALVYNPVRSVNADMFPAVFGDSFISGFIEGGEFNALVSMKILNKAKKTDIQAEAKVALTTGAVSVEAQANVGIARSNLETNTETTIQVSWSGGGHIKPMEQGWDIQSLMQAAARFPDLVADCPQRIYAILSKYDTLRSFVALKPVGCTPLQYENAQIYTNALLDAFMSYKSIYKRIGEQVFSIQAGTLEITPWSDTEAPKPQNKDIDTSGTDPKTTNGGKQGNVGKATDQSELADDLTRFEASIKGLSDARRIIRRQMAKIVKEVDDIEKDPEKATEDGKKEPFQSPLAFETRLPAVGVPARFRRRANPLTGRAIDPKPLSTEEKNKEELEDQLGDGVLLYDPGSVKLSDEEAAAFGKIQNERPGLGRDFRITSATGSEDGKFFNYLDIVQSNWVLKSINVHILMGYISYISVSYENGLLIERGTAAISKTFGPLGLGERVLSASIETAKRPGDPAARVTALGLFTNRGRTFVATAANVDLKSNDKWAKDNSEYEKLQVAHYECPLKHGTLQGLFGRSTVAGIWKLGLVWGRTAGSAEVPLETGPLRTIAIGPRIVDGGDPQARVEEDGKTETATKHIFSKDIDFNPAFSEPPVVLAGIMLLDFPSKQAIRSDARILAVTRAKASRMLRTIETPAFQLGMSWLAIPQSDKHIETGVYEFLGEEATFTGESNGRKTEIPFSRPFQKKPTVLTWLAGALCSAEVFSLQCGIPDTNTTSCTVRSTRGPASGSGSNVTGTRVGWFAYDPEECPHIQSGILAVKDAKDAKNAEKRVSGRFTFARKFSRAPSVFLGLAGFDAGNNFNLRLSGHINKVNEEGFDYDAGSWGGATDHDVRTATYIWIAVAKS